FAFRGRTTLALLVSLLAAGTAAAQNQGYSVWLHRHDGGGGWSSGGHYSRSYPGYHYPGLAYTFGAPAECYQTSYPPRSNANYGYAYMRWPIREIPEPDLTGGRNVQTAK